MRRLDGGEDLVDFISRNAQKTFLLNEQTIVTEEGNTNNIGIILLSLRKTECHLLLKRLVPMSKALLFLTQIDAKKTIQKYNCE